MRASNLTRIFLLFLTIVASISSSAQTITWDGGGGSTDWNDADNWNGDVEPSATDVARFTSGNCNPCTVTGTPTNNPMKIDVRDGVDLTLDLSMTIGSGTSDQSGVTVRNSGKITFGTDDMMNPRIININVTDSEDGISIGSGTATPEIIIGGSTTLNIQQCDDGISYSHTGGSITNNGTINITDPDNRGLNLQRNCYFQ